MTKYAGLLAVFLLLPPGWRMQGAEAYVPFGVGASLTGKKVEFPKDLRGPVSVLVVGFSRKSADQAAEWRKAITSMEACRGQRPTWYQMPVIAGAPGILRGMILRSIRSGLTREMQEHFVPVLEREEAWKVAAGYQREDDAYVLAVNEGGRIAARWHGPFAPARVEFLSFVQRSCGLP